MKTVPITLTTFIILSTLTLNLAKVKAEKIIENQLLQIGVVQRFGEKGTDKLNIKPANNGDRLSLTFLTPGGKKTISVPSIDLKITMRSLPKPFLSEYLVLSQHRSYETAENSANQWRKLGLEVEITQPNNWQVWAKRSVYNTPLLRRWLLESLQSQGHQQIKLETKILTKFPQIFWQVNGYVYQRSDLEIKAGQDLIQVNTNPDPSTPRSPDISNENIRIYPGTLALQRNAYGSYTLVNNVRLETYLRGVVPHEIESFSARSALEAQAILARTYTLRNLQRFAADNYNLCATTHCHVYKGLTEIVPETDQAIATTTGQVLTYKNELVDAVYSSATGGVTATFGDIWYGDVRPYLTSKIDATANIWHLEKYPLSEEANVRKFLQLNDPRFSEHKSEFFRWKEASSLTTLARQLKTYLREKNDPLEKLQKIIKMAVVKRSPSGRVLQMDITTDVGVVSLKKDEIHNAFWSPLSTLFYLEPEYNPNKTLWGYVFVGGGFGHGVGLSQTGAKRFGQLGWTSDRILQFYFPGTEIKPYGLSQ